MRCKSLIRIDGHSDVTASGDADFVRPGSAGQRRQLSADVQRFESYYFGQLGDVSSDYGCRHWLFVSGLPAFPVTIAPGNSISFKAAFTPVSAGSFTGSLAIGSRTFSLSGLSVSSAIPAFSITTNGAMSSQQQVNLTVQLSAPSPVAALGTITMTFTPSVASVTDDPAVLFLATGGRQLNISLASGAQTATYNSQSTITFQTGTTAGSITFAVAFPDTATYTQSFTIPAATAQLTSVQATRESPNLLVTISGYDNTYSAGQLSFTFYDTTGKVIGSPISYNAA